MRQKLNAAVDVAGQIEPSDMQDLKAAGYKAVVTARPDGEKPGQPTSDSLAAAAAEAGLAYAYLPVTPGIIPDDEAAARFAALASEGRVFAHCAMGPRAVVLASLAEALRGTPVDQILEEAAEAGINLAPLRSKLEALALGTGDLQ